MQEELQHCSYSSALKCGGYCEECQLDMQALEKFLQSTMKKISHA